jgi:hypothetical protein
VISFTPRPFCLQGNSPWYPLDRRLGGPQSRSGRGGEEKSSQPLLGLKPPIVQPVAQRSTTELSWLRALRSLTLRHFGCGKYLKKYKEKPFMALWSVMSSCVISVSTDLYM